MNHKKDILHTYHQDSAYASPWSLKVKLRMLLWDMCWSLLCRWTPKPMNGWRLIWLKIFGAKIEGRPFVHQRARIAIPWNMTMHDHSCLGDGAVAYSLGQIELMKDSTVAQEAYLCAGTHDFSHKARPLQTGKIVVGQSAFVGARAFVMPGITIGEGSIIGACSVVTKDVQVNKCVAGNPASIVRPREHS